MGKKVKKKARSGQKDKRVVTTNPKTVPEDQNPVPEQVTDVVTAVKERKGCAHLDKSIDLPKLSSKLEVAEDFRCEDCREAAVDRKATKGKGKHGKKKGNDSKAIWVCLECGHFACGGVGLPTTNMSHAVRHARQSRHQLVIQVENPHLRWCFSCSSLIPVDRFENGEQKDVLSDVIKLFKKQLSGGSSADVEDVWFGSVASEIKLGSSLSVDKRGPDFYAVRGLMNLGNTCFFNSVLQNLLAMDRLQDDLLKLNDSMGPLTSSLKKMYAEITAESGVRNVINPKSLFGCVCSKAPQFRGYQQQDSHELLRCLLDGLSTEDIRAKKSTNSCPDNKNSSRVSISFVDSIFGGQLSSTVCCVECEHSSVVYEPFLDLSLPVPTKKPPPKKVQTVTRNRKTKPPPKKVGKTRSKHGKDAILAPVLGCDPMPPSESSHGLLPSSVTAEDKGDSVNGSSSASPTHCGDMADSNGSISQSVEPAQQVASSDDFAWMDYVESMPMEDEQDLSLDNSQEMLLGDSARIDHLQPTSLVDQQNWTLQQDEVPANQESERTGMSLNNGNHQDLDKCSDEVLSHPEELNVMSSSCTYSLEDEAPLQVDDSVVLLLPYTEESVAIENFVERDTEPSSSAVGDGGEEELGLGSMFDEPEITMGPHPQPSTGGGDVENGILAGHSSESNPDEVDDSDSPVSIESCLFHFTKPELLADEHAWHCENCTRRMLEKRRKKKLKPVLTTQNGFADNFSGIGDAKQSNGTADSDMKQIRHACVEENHKLTNGFSGASETSGIFQNADNGTVHENNGSNSSEEPAELAADQSNGAKLVEDGESGESGDEEADSKSVKAMRNATKRMLISKLPPILTIHLKRFNQDARGRLSKLNGHVVFKEIVDLRPHMDSRCPEKQGDCKYRLVGLVEHLGSMRGGHYVAYVRGGDKRREEAEGQSTRKSVWYYASDAHVREVALEEVLRCEAYILFYEKV